MLRLCHEAGIDVKNQLSNLDPDQQHTLEEMVKKSSKSTTSSVPAKPVTKVVLPDDRAVPNLSARAVKRESDAARKQPTSVVEEPAAVVQEAPTPELAEAPIGADDQALTSKTSASSAALLKDRIPNLAAKSGPPAAKTPGPVAKPSSVAPVKPESKTELPRPPTQPSPSRTTTPPGAAKAPQDAG